MKKSAELPRGISQKLQKFELYLKSQRLTKGTRKMYLGRARDFMLKIGDSKTYDSLDIRKYLANFDTFTGNWARFTYYALKQFFESFDWKWDLRRPPAGTLHPNRPRLSDEQIIQIITAAKDGRLNNVEAGLAAIATTYGARRVELGNLRREDRDFQRDTITIRAMKGGRERIHLIPPKVKVFIDRYDFKPRGATSLDNIFDSIMLKCGIENGRRMGWHSIRRALNTGLRGVIAYRKEYLRWRMDDIDMVYDGTPPEQIDRIVFAKHPFLGAWK